MFLLTLIRIFTLSLLASMALLKFFVFVVLALAGISLSSCQQVLKGKVSCLDCPQHYDLSGIKILVKCDKVKKLTLATTAEDGIFQVDLPSDANPNSQTSTPKKCDAKLFGGPNQIYATNTNMMSSVVKATDSNSYTISTPLAFSTTCSANGKDANCENKSKNTNTNMFDSSEVLGLPVPPEWGLAPASFYVPFIPIIGIP